MGRERKEGRIKRMERENKRQEGSDGERGKTMECGDERWNKNGKRQRQRLSKRMSTARGGVIDEKRMKENGKE